MINLPLYIRVVSIPLKQSCTSPVSVPQKLFTRIWVTSTGTKLNKAQSVANGVHISWFMYAGILFRHIFLTPIYFVFQKTKIIARASQANWLLIVLCCIFNQFGTWRICTKYSGFFNDNLVATILSPLCGISITFIYHIWSNFINIQHLKLY